MSRIPIDDRHGGYFWVPTDDQTGLDGSERRHAPRAPRASTTLMLRAVSQHVYAPQAPGDQAPQARPAMARPARLPDPGTCLRRLADSVRLQDDGATSGP